MASFLSSIGGALCRNIWAGTRLALFLPIARSSFRFGAVPLAMAWALALLVYCGVQLPFFWPVGSLSSWGVGYLLATFFSSIAALHLGAILIGRGTQSGRLQVMIVSAIPLPYLASFALTIGVAQGVLPLKAGMAIYLALALPLIAALRGTALLGRPAVPHGLVPAAMLAGAVAFNAFFLQPFPIFEGSAVDAEGDVETWIPADIEAVYYAQPGLLEAELGGLRTGVPGEVELFAVLAAYYPHEAVFLREVEAVGSLLEERFEAAARVVRLANSRDHPERYPLANVRNLNTALMRVAEVMDPEEDVLLLFLTSHGSEEIVSAGYWELGTADLDAATLAGLLAASGIRHAVVVVSACHSGSFIPQLEVPDRLIITASAAERNSFGCSNENEWTYFGEAYFDRALRTTHDFRTAFDTAAALVAEWENEFGQLPSEPQIALGAGIEPVLEQLAAEADGR